MKQTSSLSLLLLTAFALLSVAVLPAADPPPPPDAPRRPGSPGGAPPGQRFPVNPMNRGGGGFPVERVLNEEQREQFREELQTQRSRMRELDEKGAMLRREYEEALFAEKLDEKLVREKAVALGELDADRALIRARAFAKIRPSLSQEQTERLRMLRAEPRDGGPPEADFRRPRPGQPIPRERLDRPRPRQPGEAEGDPLPPPRPPPPPR